MTNGSRAVRGCSRPCSAGRGRASVQKVIGSVSTLIAVHRATGYAELRGLLLPGTDRAPQPAPRGPTLTLHGHEERDPRLPDHAARADHARGGGSEDLRAAPRARAAPRR